MCDETATDQSQEPGTELDELEDVGLAAEFWMFLKENKKWWLIPILVSIALLGGLVLLSGTGAAPFIYTLF